MSTGHRENLGSVNSHWLGAGFLFIAAFINTLDATIVNLGLPSIKQDLSASDTSMQWVLVVYVLAFAAGLLPFGRFGDVYGRRRLFVWGLTGFIAASAWCGAVQDVETLIVARTVKGLAAATMLPQVLAIIRATFPANDMSKAIGYFAMVSGFGAMAGPLVGGLLISADFFGLGWRLIFLINVPLGAIALAGVIVFLPDVKERHTQHVDWTGALLFAAAISALLYPMIEGRALGWPIWLMMICVLAVVLMGAFLRSQYLRAARNRTQLLPVRMLKNPGFLIGIGGVTLLFAGIAGSIVVLTIVLQSGFGLSPAIAGGILAAHPLSAMAASFATGQMGTRLTAERTLLGCLSILIGMIWLQALIGTEVQSFVLWGPLVLTGAGMGSATVAMFQSVLREVPGADAGAGAGALQAFQQIGIALGVAIVGQVFFAALEQSAGQSRYVEAIETALWLPIAIYSFLSLGAVKSFLTERARNAH
ncbi:MAG: MFS transporter [Pseudomonadota bacterium]